MAGYTVIADIGNAIVSLLRKNMVPDVILNPESIGLCSPGEKGDVLLGVYLYDVKENEEFRNGAMVSAGVSYQKYPSKFLTLSYMITAYSNGDVKFKTAEEHKILGRTLQVLSDYPILDPISLKPMEALNGIGIQIEMQTLSQEDKMKIWTVPNKAYQLSLFFKVGPVEMESSKTKEIQRVVDVDFYVKEQ